MSDGNDAGEDRDDSGRRREETPRDGGYDDWLDAVATGEAYYLACPAGHGWLPPRRVCPTCGSTDLERRALAETGTVETVTTVHVAAPNFADDVPYATAIASFGPVRLTGVVRGGDAGGESEAAETGAEVEAAVGESETTGERLLVLRPR